MLALVVLQLYNCLYGQTKPLVTGKVHRNEISGIIFPGRLHYRVIQYV